MVGDRVARARAARSGPVSQESAEPSRLSDSRSRRRAGRTSPSKVPPSSTARSLTTTRTGAGPRAGGMSDEGQAVYGQDLQRMLSTDVTMSYIGGWLVDLFEAAVSPGQQEEAMRLLGKLLRQERARPLRRGSVPCVCTERSRRPSEVRRMRAAHRESQARPLRALHQPRPTPGPGGARAAEEGRQ